MTDFPYQFLENDERQEAHAPISHLALEALGDRP